MVSKSEYERSRKLALEYLRRAGIAVTPNEEQRLEVADFGLREWQQSEREILTYGNTDRVCARELALFPGQTCPEHRPPP